MSRIGKAPIPVPAGVTVSIADGRVAVKGPKGELSREIPGAITIREEAGELLVERPDDERQNRALHGMFRSLVNNMVDGERRWRAAQLAGLTEAPVVERIATDREVLELARSAARLLPPGGGGCARGHRVRGAAAHPH